MNPSCAVTKFTLACGCRPDELYRSLLPARRVASSGSVPRSPRQKRRTASRYLPFHSVQPGREVADLIAALADVPRLGDELHARDHGILLDDVEERRQPIDRVQLARERGREVEAEAIHVHVLDPVAQAVHHQLQHVRRLHVQRVAGAGEVLVARRPARLQPVVARVVDAAERQRGTVMIALGGVVVDDVENHFETRGVQRADHRLEFAWRRRPDSRETANRVSGAK